MLIMLEDDQERIARFKLVLANTGLTLAYSRTAQDFIRQYLTLGEVPKLIALDHDLFTDNENDPDPGDGRDVAAFLATQPTIAPILIHSTNAVAADSMLFTLADAGWKVDRIAPIGSDWIESFWFPTAMNLVGALDV